MAQSVKLADDIMDTVRKDAARQSRSVAGQITHCIKIARAIEKSKNFDFTRIEQVLDAALSPDDLTADEQDVWFDKFTQAMTQPSATEEAFYENRRKLGRGVGLSENGDLVTQDAAKP